MKHKGKDCPNCWAEPLFGKKHRYKMQMMFVTANISSRYSTVYRGWLQVGWYCRHCGHMEYYKHDVEGTV